MQKFDPMMKFHEKYSFLYSYNMKNYSHILGPLIFFIVAVVIHSITQGEDMAKKTNAVHLYQMESIPHSWSDAFSNIKSSFATYWPNDDCYKITQLNESATCLAQRTSLRTTVLSHLACDKYQSQMCNCVQEVLNGVKAPESEVAKVLTDKKDTVLYAVESCRWVMHNANTAVYYVNIWAQRTAIFLFFTFMVLGNAIYNVWLLPMTFEWESEVSKGLWRGAFCLVWAVLGLTINIASEINSYAVALILLFPSLVIMVMFESLRPYWKFASYPFLHPFFFGAILNALVFLSHVETGVNDFDILVFELMKSNIATFIYMQLVWRYMVNWGMKNNDQLGSDLIEECSLRSTLLLGALYIVGLMAPYPQSTTANFMWYSPLAWLLLGVCSVIWIASQQYAENKPKESPILSTASTHVSSLIMVFTFLILLYYIRDHSLTYGTFIEHYPEKSIQYNVSQTWQRAPVVAATYVA